MKRPFLISAVLGTGLVTAAFYCRSVILAAVFILFLLSFEVIVKKKIRGISILLLVSIIISFSLIINFSDINRIEKLKNTVITEDFIINEEPYCYVGGFSVSATCLSSNVLRKGDKIELCYSEGDIYIGDTVTVNFKMESIKHSRYMRSNYSRGIYAMGNVLSFSSVETDNSLLSFVPKLKKNVKTVLLNNMSYENQSFVSALIIGDKYDIDKSFDEKVKASGTSHILVVSGMHLVILLGGIKTILERFLYNKYVFFIISLIFVFAFSAVCGFTMSVIRAGVTYLFLSLAPLFNRDSDPLNTLGVAVTTVIMFSPFAIFSVSFQLSVLSTYGILALAPYLTDKILMFIKIDSKIFTALIQGACVTFSATVLTAPITIYYFGFISIVGVVTNLLVTYAVTGVLLITALGIVASFILGSGYICRVIFAINNILTDYTTFVIDFFGDFKLSTIPVPKWFVIVFLIAAGSFLLLAKLSYLINKKKAL